MKYTIQKVFGSYSICIENDSTANNFYDVQKDIIDIIKQLEQERNNYKELYEKEKEKTDKAQKWIGEYEMQWDLYDEIQTDLNELNNILGGSNE